MKRLKGFFFITSLFISVLMVWNFLKTSTDFSSKTEKTGNFKIIEISGDGVFYKSPLIDRENIQKMDLSDQITPKKLSLYVDNNTTFKFRFYDTFITVLPDSFIKYDHSKLSLLKGEFYWEQVTPRRKKNAAPHSISLPENRKLFLSQKGRMIVSDPEVQVWNFKGPLTVWSDNTEFKLKMGQFLSLKPEVFPEPVNFPPKPVILRPENNIVISSAKDTIIQFQWKEISDLKQNNVTEYILRLYSSPNMGRLSEDLEKNVNGTFSAERKSSSTNIPIDFSALTHTNTLYWRIFPYDNVLHLEGEPSEIRKLQIADFLLNNKKAQLPPKLYIDPPIISGNIVILSGDADPKSRLFIDGKEYEIDKEGKFNLNISFDKSGIYTILFELISPADRRNIQKKIVRIY